MSNNTDLVTKWGKVLNHEKFEKIPAGREGVIATILENTQASIQSPSPDQVSLSSMVLTEAAPTNSAGTGGFSGSATAAGPVAGYDPVLINLVRRTMPNLIAYDIAGVQPMTGPTGLIFAMRSKYIANTASSTARTSGPEAFYGEANTAFSGTGTHAGTTGGAATANSGTAMATAAAEALGTGSGTDYAEMGLTIEKVTVAAQSRALKAEYSTELAQDLRSVHGLDVESELSNILSSEILAEINREVLRTVYTTAVTGSPATATAGTFNLDVDSNGRWAVEKFKGLMFQIEIEANAIAKATRRGKGNIVICSSDVASALQMAGVLDYTPALNSNALSIDDTGATFAGVLNGRFRVYIDPYAGSNYLVVGYKGSQTFDAGLFYCPYVPLQMSRVVDPNSFQPAIGFKTRYGMVANPFAAGSSQGLGALTANTNVYYRRTIVTSLF